LEKFGKGWEIFWGIGNYWGKVLLNRHVCIKVVEWSEINIRFVKSKGEKGLWVKG